MQNEQGSTHPHEISGFDVEKLITSSEEEVNGKWFPFPGGARVKVARSGNTKFKQMVRSKFKASRAILEQDDDMSAELSEEIMIEVYAHTILKDIENIRVNGEVAKYTPSLGIKLLSIRDFNEKIKAYAENGEGFRMAVEDAIVKS